ncbi:hypothetical protein BG011_009625 [Mortierella polycephala]|uniref:Uncharacterized protein n=1 Tax=Mortierella polycephala TaxID=41804 RepID=A0A9P6TVK2_9FUNG|nr:hypothetical protein BG011_009625 [Mortierella polycephala]
MRCPTPSDSATSVVSTKRSKKRITFQEAIAQLTDQRDLLAQQIALEKEDMEDRKMQAQRQEEREGVRDARLEQEELEKKERIAAREHEDVRLGAQKAAGNKSLIRIEEVGKRTSVSEDTKEFWPLHK